MESVKACTILKYFFIILISFFNCKKDSSEEDSTKFFHNSPRPECRYIVDPGRVAYFEKPIVVSADWSEPVKLAGPLTDQCPNDAIEISRDGMTLYFFWSPTVKGTNEELLHIHTGTYYAKRVGDDPGLFGTPLFFDLQKGTREGSVDGRLSFTLDGDSVYFHSTRITNTGYQHKPVIDDPMDIYVAAIIKGEPGPAVNLGEPVNSVYLDGEHALSPDGSKLFLTSNRPGGLGEADIWVSTRIAGGWSTPVNIGPPVNSTYWEGQPGYTSNDPNTMYFVSNRDGPGSIYRSTYDGVSWSNPKMLITGYVGEPSIIADGTIMYFVHVLIDDEDVFGSNIWYVRRLTKE